MSASRESTAGWNYVIRKNNLDTIKSGALEFSQDDATIEASLAEPAMLYVEVTGPNATRLHLGAGVYALQPNTVTDRAVEGWLALDVDSHDLSPTQATGVAANYSSIGNTDRETSYFLTMYLRDARAIDYIRSRPDWDGKTIVIMGTSMGGQQSLVTAALRPGVTAVIVNEPSGADSNGNLHGRKAGYPNWPSNDPPVGIWTAIDQIPGAREVVSMVESDHNNRTPEKQLEYNARAKEVLGIILNGGEFKPK